MESIAAVVVTYNRKQLLKECIEALRSQARPVDQIVVVNNGSSDGTEIWLSRQTDIITINQKNVGSAGGFSAGLKHAYNLGHTRMWCMDDDGYPDTNALAELLRHAPAGPALLNCAVINKEDKSSFVWKTGNHSSVNLEERVLLPDVAHPFNGTLIHREIIAKAGLPKSALFVWGDESEYLQRIKRRFNFPVFTVTTSLHFHPPSAFHYRADWSFKDHWKMYYYVRNRWQIHQAKYSNKAYAFINYLSFFIALSAVIIFFQKTDKFSKLGFIFWPLLHVIKNNYEVQPGMIMDRLHAHRNNGILSALKNYYRLFRHPFAPDSPEQYVKA